MEVKNSTLGAVEGGTIKTKIYMGIAVFVMLLMIILYITKYSNSDDSIGVNTRSDAKKICRFVEGCSYYESLGSNYWSMWPNTNNIFSIEHNNTNNFNNWINNIDRLHKTTQAKNEFLNFKRTIFSKSNASKWVFLLNVVEDTPGNIPIMMTSDLDPALLIDLLKHDKNSHNTVEKDELKSGLFLMKNGLSFFVHPTYFSGGSAKRHGNDNIDTSQWPNNLYYLTQTGIVSVIQTASEK